MKLITLLLSTCLCATMLECKQARNKNTSKISRREKRKLEQRDDLYAKIAPTWFNSHLRAKYMELTQTASVDEQLDWLRDQMEAKKQLEKKRDALYKQFVENMTETQRYNYAQRPTLREQVQWLEKYERTMRGLSGGLQEYDIDDDDKN